MLQQWIAQIYSWLNDAIKHVYGDNKCNGSSCVIYEEGLFSEHVDSSGDKDWHKNFSRSSRDLGGRRMSMDDYDKPNIRRLSLTGAE